MIHYNSVKNRHEKINYITFDRKKRKELYNGLENEYERPFKKD